MNDLGAKLRGAARGTVWIGAGEALRTAAELVATIFAARLLAPRDLGLLGIVLLLMAMLDAFSRPGFENALVQAPEEVEDLLDVAWTAHLVRALVVSAVMIAAAPVLVRLYSEPVLLPLIAASTLHVMLLGMQNTGAIMFNRRLEFPAVFLVNAARALTYVIVSVLGVVMWRSVWGLMVGLVASTFVATLSTYALHPHRPRLRWERAKLRRLVDYGRWITGVSALTFVTTNGDAAFVSKALGTGSLGEYQMAFRLSNLPATKITHVLAGVTFPLYSRLQASPLHLRSVFLSTLRSTLLLSGLVSALIWIASPAIVTNVIGEKWANILPLVRILVLAAFIRSFVALAGPLFQAMNCPDLDLKMNLPRLLCLVVFLGPCAWAWGLRGVCVAVLVSVCASVPVWLWGVKRLLGIGFLEVLRVAAAPTGAAVGVVAITEGARAVAVQAAAHPAAGTVAGLVGWMLLVWIVGSVTPLRLLDDLRRAIQLARGRAIP